MTTTTADDDQEMLELTTPVKGLTEMTTTVPAPMAKLAASMASEHPATNQRLVGKALAFWMETAGPNDPITRSLVSWLCYLCNDGVSQLDAGLTIMQHEALVDRLEELGIEVEV